MTEKKNKDEIDEIRKVIEQGSASSTVDELAKRGVQKVRVIREDQINALIQKAVLKVVERRSQNLVEEERVKVISQSRKELDNMMNQYQQTLENQQQIAQSRDALKHELEILRQQGASSSQTLEDQVSKLLDSLERAEESRVKAEEDLESARIEMADLRETLGEVTEDRERLQVRVRELLLASSAIVQEAYFLEQDLLANGQEENAEADDRADEDVEMDDPTKELYRDMERTAGIITRARQHMLEMMKQGHGTEAAQGDGVFSALEGKLQQSHQREQEKADKIQMIEGDMQQMVSILGKIFT